MITLQVVRDEKAGVADFLEASRRTAVLTVGRAVA
jgi:hypothetical protein